MNLNKIDEVKNIANPLFKWPFGLLSSRNFATIARWRNDFSLLIQKKLTTNLSLSEGVSGGGSSASDLPKIKNKNKKACSQWEMHKKTSSLADSQIS